MAAPPPSTTSTANLLTTHRALLDTITSFLTVCTHHILYLRAIYPGRSFLATRAYNYPVRQNRHPAVCTWINDAIAAIRSQLQKSTVEKVQLCIYETDHNRVLERWTFDLRMLPSIPRRDQDVPFESSSSDNDALSKPLNITDIEATFRATLSRITTASSRLKPLPSSTDDSSGGPECSFTLTIEVRNNADRPVGRIDKHERAWIVAEPEASSFSELSISSGSKEGPPMRPTGRKEDDGATTPIRRLEAGELRMELWVEESAAKFSYDTSSQQRTAEQRAKDMSYGAGTEKFSFDPENGYNDVEGTDVNRKPDTGRGAV